MKKVVGAGNVLLGRCSSELAQLVHFVIFNGGLLIILIDCMIFVTIPRYYKGAYVNSFFPCTARLWRFSFDQ